MEIVLKYISCFVLHFANFSCTAAAKYISSTLNRGPGAESQLAPSPRRAMDIRVVNRRNWITVIVSEKVIFRRLGFRGEGGGGEFLGG